MSFFIVQYHISFRFKDLRDSRMLPHVSLFFKLDSFTGVWDRDHLLAACTWIILYNWAVNATGVLWLCFPSVLCCAIHWSLSIFPPKIHFLLSGWGSDDAEQGWPFPQHWVVLVSRKVVWSVSLPCQLHRHWGDLHLGRKTGWGAGRAAVSSVCGVALN